MKNLDKLVSKFFARKRTKEYNKSLLGVSTINKEILGIDFQLTPRLVADYSIMELALAKKIVCFILPIFAIAFLCGYNHKYAVLLPLFLVYNLYKYASNA